MTQLVLLAIALAMDAFAVSIGLGAKQSSVSARNTTEHGINFKPENNQTVLKLALLSGLYLGIAQGIMPLIGYWLLARLSGNWLVSFSSPLDLRYYIS